MKVPESAYNRLKALGEPPIGVRPPSITPSISNAIPNEGLCDYQVDLITIQLYIYKNEELYK